MPKQRIQDILVKNKKIFNRNFGQVVSSTQKKTPTGRKIPNGKIIFSILIILVFIILSAKILNAFSGAVIKIKLHTETIEVDTIIKAGKDKNSDISFETMELELDKQKNTKATGIKNVATKSSGQITIYNTYNSLAQTLIKNTRFETPDGKIYRTNERISVPGTKVENGKIIPGAKEVTVYADNPGEEYNIGLADFTIPGFKDGPRYEKFYAKSKTPMTGGFEGETPIVSEEDAKNLQESIEKELEKELREKANQQKPEDYILYDGSISISFQKQELSSENQLDSKNPIYTLKETGSLFAYLLSKQELSRILVKKYLGEEMVEKVEVGNLEELSFEIINTDLQGNILLFKLRGQAKFIWIIEGEKLKEALMASSKDLEQVFETYPAIEQATIVFKPSWWRFFPDKSSKISVEPITE